MFFHGFLWLIVVALVVIGIILLVRANNEGAKGAAGGPTRRWLGDS